MSLETPIPDATSDTIFLPEQCLLLLVGPAGVGKSTFAKKHFKSTEILSSDFFRGMICDDESYQGASRDAFEVLHLLANHRLAWGRLTVIDATNLQPEARKPLLELARRHHIQTAAIVFLLPLHLIQQRNQQRQDRVVPEGVVASHWEKLQAIPGALQQEKVKKVIVLDSPEKIETIQVVRYPLRVNLRHETGPFDIVGDVHGCFDELVALLENLGYTVLQVPEEGPAASPRWRVQPPAGRKLVLVGDLVDRGPRVADVLRLVMDAVADGAAICAIGNHDDKLLRKLRGRDVRLTHGLVDTLAQLDREPPGFRARVLDFLDSLCSHYVLDGGRLVVAHAGLRKDMHGRMSGGIHSFAIYGDTTGETDTHGLPVRRDWALEYDGRAMVVYGHTPVQEPEWCNGTINIDTGCVFGGKLTALRYPEKELVSVPAARVYAEYARPFLPPRFARTETPSPGPDSSRPGD